MPRYLRLYGHFVRFSFARASQFRLDFFFRVGMDALWYGHYLAFFALLSGRTPTLGGFDAADLRVFTATLFVVDALQMTLFSNNAWAFPFLVNKGDLDYHLVRPVSPLFMVTLRDFAVNSFLNFLMACGILVWALVGHPRPIPLSSLALYLALLPFSLALHAALHFAFLTPVFWTHSAHGLGELFWTVEKYGNRPVGIYRGWVRYFLLTVLPLGVVVTFPTRVIVEGPSWDAALHLVGAAVFVLLALGFLWKRGLRAYASASS
jgi:ABC-2 type transport system permease protein